MAFYQYKTKDQRGLNVTGLVEAPSAQAAARLLSEKDLFVIDLHETAQRLGASGYFAKFQRVGFSEVVNFTRQLSTMINAGLSLPDALSILGAQTTNPKFSQILLDIEHLIVGGGNLADSLAKHPAYFNPIYTALVRAGESSGKIDKVLLRLADTLEGQREFQNKVKGALVYPIIVILGMLIVVFIMMTVVVPKLTDLYKDFGIGLPFATQLLISVSGFFAAYWWMVIAGSVASGLGFAKWRKTPIGERMIDSVLLQIPVFGELLKQIILVDFTRTLSMLIGSGIHILEGLKVLRDALGNVRFREAIDEVGKRIEKGFPLGDTFAQFEVFPPIVAQMMKVGEETGKLDETLLKLSDYFESESEHAVKNLTAAIEPLIMVILGIGVGFIVISVITPIYNLTSQFK